MRLISKKKKLKAVNEQKEQLKKVRVKKKKTTNKKIEKEEKPGQIVLLNDILDVFGMNFSSKGEDILKKLAKDERMISYNDLFFKTGDGIIENFGF